MRYLVLLGVCLLWGQAGAYSDTSDSLYTQAIDQLSQKGWVQGYSDNTFRPDEPINRAEFVKLLMATKYQRQVDYQTQSNKSCFSDIPSPVWYRPYVCVAQTRGVIDGYDDGSFKAANIINKAEAVKILYQFYFEDPVRSSVPWYQTYYDALERKGIKLNLFNQAPDKPLTRGEMAFAIAQFELYPGHALAPPEPQSVAFNLHQNQNPTPTETIPEVVPEEPNPAEEPQTFNQVVATATPTETTTNFNLLAVSPLRVITTPHPGRQVTGGYISNYNQWQAAKYEASTSNHTLTDAQEKEWAVKVLSSVNQARTNAGKANMRQDNQLQGVAQNFAEHLVINAIYSHSDKLGNDPIERSHKAGIEGWVAESIVWRNQDPLKAIEWWRGSPVHWNNVSNSRFTRAGVGIAKEPNGGYIVVLYQGE